MDGVFFLSPIYLTTLVIAAIVVGILFTGVNNRSNLTVAGLLFILFAGSQLVFRIIFKEEPDRLLGQIIYFLTFLVIIDLTREVKSKLIT